MDEDDEDPREPPLDLRSPDYLPESFWHQPPPWQLHLEPDRVSAYLEDDEDSMLGELGWNLHVDDNRKYQFGEFYPFGEACSISSIFNPIDGGRDTSNSVAAATNCTTATTTMSEESIEEEEEKSENKPSLEIA